MATHKLKTWPTPFQATQLGNKTYEIRKNDRNFNVGDTLILEEYDPTTQEYTGRVMTVRVTYITQGGEWKLPPDICVMAIQFEKNPLRG